MELSLKDIWGEPRRFGKGTVHPVYFGTCPWLHREFWILLVSMWVGLQRAENVLDPANVQRLVAPSFPFPGEGPGSSKSRDGLT